MRMLEATSLGLVHVQHDTLCVCTWELEHRGHDPSAQRVDGLGYRV